MSEFVAVESIKDALAECPICTDYFHDPSRIPRRMPCCSQAICEPCLETYIKGRQQLPCPLCRQQHHLPGGVRSLPKEMVVLRFLDVLKTKRDAVPCCTDCPDNNSAMARCDNCNVYLCQPCLAAHSRHRMSRNHKTVTFEEIKHLHSQRSSCGDTHQKFKTSSKQKKKLKNIRERIKGLEAVSINLDQSKKATADQINVYFDDLIDEMQQRRGILLSQMGSRAAKEQNVITRAIEAHKALHDKLQEDKDSQKSKLPEDIQFSRRGVSFIEDNKAVMTDMIRTSGLVRTITFVPADGASEFDEDSENCVTIENIQASRVSSATEVTVQLMPINGSQGDQCSPGDQVLLRHGNPIVCPDMKYDPNLSNEDITISGSVIANCKPQLLPEKTGCRLRSRRVFLSKPFPFPGIKRCLYLLKVNFTIKKVLPPNFMIWEQVSKVNPKDVDRGESDGFGIMVKYCDKHENSLCLQIGYGRCWPILKSKPGASGTIHIAVLLDAEQEKIHVLDVDDASLLVTQNVSLIEPLLTSMYIGREENSNVRVELITGRNVRLSTSMMKLLSTL